jgi:hypothetical protein
MNNEKGKTKRIIISYNLNYPLRVLIILFN